MSFKNARIACSVNNRIMLGNVSPSGIDFIGTPKNVTSDCLKAIIEFVGVGNETTVTSAGKPAFVITVKAVKE